MRILIITAVPFWRGATGADGRIAALTQWLRRQGDARVAYLGRVDALAERSGDTIPIETPATWLTYGICAFGYFRFWSRCQNAAESRALFSSSMLNKYPEPAPCAPADSR